MRWSYSRLTSFGQCKYEFYLNYIIHDDEQYLAEGNYYAELGSFVHEILAKIFDKKLTPDEASQYFADNYDSNVCYEVKKSTMEKSYEACADYFSSVDFGWLNDYEILGVELEMNFQINDHPFIAFIDLLLRDKKDGKIIVVDHKSTQYPLKSNGEVKKNSQESFLKYKRQMYLYAYAIKERYGEFPKEIWWNHFKDGGKWVKIPFNEDEYKEAVNWFSDTVSAIVNEENFEPTLEYFYCKNLCNFRNCCEYCSEEWK